MGDKIAVWWPDSPWAFIMGRYKQITTKCTKFKVLAGHLDLQQMTATVRKFQFSLSVMKTYHLGQIWPQDGTKGTFQSSDSVLDRKFVFGGTGVQTQGFVLAASTIPLEPCLRPFLLQFVSPVGPLAHGRLKPQSSYLCLPSSWDYNVHHHALPKKTVVSYPWCIRLSSRWKSISVREGKEWSSWVSRY
jgi:hypothetical protein